MPVRREYARSYFPYMPSHIRSISRIGTECRSFCEETVIRVIKGFEVVNLKIYTTGGDGGKTSLIGESNVIKSDPRIMCLGALDELNAHLGLIKAMVSSDGCQDRSIEHIQTILLALSGQLAGSGKGVELSDVKELESKIDEMQNALPENDGFIIPGFNALSAEIDVARTVCRRAESHLAAVSAVCVVDDDIKKYINRLSDFLFMYARHREFMAKVEAAVHERLADTLPKESRQGLSLAAAKTMMDSITQKAATLNLSVAVAVVNAHGNPVAVHVMDDAYFISYDAAMNKAVTAAALKMSTEALYPHTQPGGMFFGLETIGGGRITTIAGGVPLLRQGAIVGGLGVSGGTDKQDKLLAAHGLEVFKDVRS